MRWFLFFLTFNLVACSDRTSAPIVPDALSIGTNRTVFVGTTRMEEENGVFGVGRSSTLRLLELDISIPPNREAGTISDGQDTPDPKKDFAIAKRKTLATPQSFQQRLRTTLSDLPAQNREVTVFVHGYNNSFSDAVFRTAQLSEDLELPGASVAYAWPSRGHILGYEYDNDSALFARDGLRDLLETIQSSGAQRIVVIAHSLGSGLAMEALRQLELSKPGWASKNISGVILFSPDLNADVFRSQTDAFENLPQPFVVFTSSSDKVLKVSARLRWEKMRLGNLQDIEEFADLPIQFIDVSAFTDGESGNHFVAGTSSTLLSILNSRDILGENFLSGKSAVTAGLPGQRRILRNATQIILTPGGDR